MKKIMQIVGIFLISVMFSNISTPVVCEAQTQNQKEADGIDLPDGDYLVQADLTGGSGRASSRTFRIREQSSRSNRVEQPELRLYGLRR